MDEYECAYVLQRASNCSNGVCTDQLIEKLDKLVEYSFIMLMNMMNKRKRNSLRVVDSFYITGVAMVLTQLVLFLQFKCTESASTIALPDCPESCGGIPIPYPFGIGQKCSPSLYFNVTCDQPYYNDTPTPYLFASFPILYKHVLGPALVLSVL